jgi:AcrR family transcriptional regulator
MHCCLNDFELSESKGSHRLRHHFLGLPSVRLRVYALSMSRTPTTNGARQTRDRVLNAALELFNERGSTAVTTNHVAASAGISPGNLYYWFSDKEEIIRELYAQFVAAYEGVWGTGDGPVGLTPEEVLASLAEGTELSRRYAFLARDLLGLLHADAALAAEYRAVRARRIEAFTGLARSWRARGLIRPLDDESVDDLVQALWVIAETWLAFAELDGSGTDAQDGTRLLRVVLRPYLTPEPLMVDATARPIGGACGEPSGHVLGDDTREAEEEPHALVPEVSRGVEHQGAATVDHGDSVGPAVLGRGR